MYFYTLENTSAYIITFNSHRTPKIHSIVLILQMMKLKFMEVLVGLPRFTWLVPAELEAKLEMFDLEFSCHLHQSNVEQPWV